MQQVLSIGYISARSEILARFAKFFKGLREAPSHEVRVATFLVSRDLRTVTGRNFRLVEEESGLDPWITSSARIKLSLAASELVEVCDSEKWRIVYLSKLLEQRQELHYNGCEHGHIDGLIDSICIN